MTLMAKYGLLLVICASVGTRAEENLALGAKTSQSSEYAIDHGEAWKAVDGNTSPDYKVDHSCTHTEIQDNPWWMVELREMSVIHSVEITNRLTDGERLRKFTISMSRSVMGDGITLKEPSMCHHQQEEAMGAGLTHRFSCSAPVYARYVQIRIHAVEFLTLCEVQVWGTKGSPPICPAYRLAPGRKSSDMVLKDSTVTSRVNCIADCYKHPRCSSFKIKDHQNTSVQCELLEDIREFSNSDIGDHDGWSYYRVVDIN